MTVLLILALSQHAVISAKAGLVTYAEGVVNVTADQHVGEGNSLVTGPAGRSEMMLVPDSYLRVYPNTSVRLDSERLDQLELALEGGSAVVDIRRLDDDLPIRMRVGSLDIMIRKEGVYLFNENQIAVLDGELRVGHEETRLKEGRSLVWMEGAFSEIATGDTLEGHPLIRWSESRRERLTPAPRRIPIRPRGRRFRF